MNKIPKKIDNNLADILILLENKLKIIFGSSLKKIILYGSYARGDNDNESDIDLILLLDDNSKKNEQSISDLAAEFLIGYNILFSIVLESESQFYKYMDVLPYFQNIHSEGIEIYG